MFEAVHMVQIKKVHLLQKLLCRGVRLVLLVEVRNRFAKLSSSRLRSVLWKIASSSYDWKVASDAGSEKNCENFLKAEIAFWNL